MKDFKIKTIKLKGMRCNIDSNVWRITNINKSLEANMSLRTTVEDIFWAYL